MGQVSVAGISILDFIGNRDRRGRHLAGMSAMTVGSPRPCAVLLAWLPLVCACPSGGGDPGIDDLACAWNRPTQTGFVCQRGEVDIPPVGDPFYDFRAPLAVAEARSLIDDGLVRCWYEREAQACECRSGCHRVTDLEGATICNCSWGDFTDEVEPSANSIVRSCSPEGGGVCCSSDLGCTCKDDEIDCAWKGSDAVQVEKCEPLAMTEPEDDGWSWVASCDAAPWPTDGPGSDGASGDPTASGGLPDGEPCTADDQCQDGSLCLPPLFLDGGPSTCGPACTVETQADDCAALAALDVRFDVPLGHPSGEGTNVWNSSVLVRGNACGSGGHCQYLCPPDAAIALDDAGNPAGCACLPHFTWTSDQTACVWDDTVECALLERAGEPNPCDACNSTQLLAGCSTGRFQCLLQNNSFEGECVEWAEFEELDACIAGEVGYDCDPTCYQSCASASCSAEYCNVNGCLDLCCEATTAPPTDGGC